MDPDKLQQAWQAQSTQTRVTVDANLLLKEVQRNEQEFRETIFRRDCAEVGVALLLLPVWFIMGFAMALPWTWYLEVPALIWTAGFFLVDRKRHSRKPSEAGNSLFETATESLTQVEHQIWLLRSIAWWYLLPSAVPMLAFFFHTSWLVTQHWLAAIFLGTFWFIFTLAIYSFLYYINQVAVRKQLEPRRQELLALLGSLKDESTSEVSGEFPILLGAGRAKPTRRQALVIFLLAAVAFVVLFSIGMAIIYLASGTDHPEKSPFAAVRWQGSQPEVKIGEEWFKLVLLDDLPAAEIVAFGQRTYGDKWQKRFEEDLVALSTQMGHPPGDTVTLVVHSLTSPQTKPPETRTFKDVPMTRANRQAIRDAALDRGHGGK